MRGVVRDPPWRPAQTLQSGHLVTISRRNVFSGMLELNPSLWQTAIFVEAKIDFTHTECTVLFPSGRWFTAEVETLRQCNGLTFVDLTERVAQFEADPATVIPLPATGMRKSSGSPTVRAVIRAGDGLTWDQVRIEVGASRTVLFKAPGQSGKYVFPPNSQLQKDHPLGMLMRLAANGEWRNPPLGSPEYERVSRAFRRLRKLLMALVPLPGDPFQPHRGAFVPAFQIGVKRGLLPENLRDP